MYGLSTSENSQKLTDEDLIMRVKAKPWLFSILLDRYQDAFLRKALGIVRNKDDAEEVVQDTFTKIYINADRFKVQEGAKFTSWAYRILMNTAFTRYQKLVKEGKRVVSIDPEFEHMIGGRQEHSGFEVTRDAIDRILVRLPGHFAYVLRLHYLERWSHKDIAKETGEEVGTVKARIHRAKEAFRKESNEAELPALLE